MFSDVFCIVKLISFYYFIRFIVGVYCIVKPISLFLFDFVFYSSLLLSTTAQNNFLLVDCRVVYKYKITYLM